MGAGFGEGCAAFVDEPETDGVAGAATGADAAGLTAFGMGETTGSGRATGAGGVIGGAAAGLAGGAATGWLIAGGIIATRGAAG